MRGRVRLVLGYQLVGELGRLVESLLAEIDGRQAPLENAVVRGVGHHLLQERDALVDLPRSHVEVGEHDLPVRVVLAQVGEFLVLRLGLLHPLALQVEVAQRRHRVAGLRDGLERRLVLRLGFGETVPEQVEVPQGQAGLHGTAVVLDDLPVQPLGLGQVQLGVFGGVRAQQLDRRHQLRLYLQAFADFQYRIVDVDDPGVGVGLEDLRLQHAGELLEDQLGLGPRVLELFLQQQEEARPELRVGVPLVRADGRLHLLQGFGVGADLHVDEPHLVMRLREAGVFLDGVLELQQRFFILSFPGVFLAVFEVGGGIFGTGVEHERQQNGEQGRRADAHKLA